MAKARLRRGIEIVKLANRIEALKMQEDESDSAPGDADVPADATATADAAVAAGNPVGPKKSLSNLSGGAIFREVVMAKVREKKQQEEALKVEKEAHENEARRRSFQG